MGIILNNIKMDIYNKSHKEIISNVNNLEKYIINGEKLKHDYIKWEIDTSNLPNDYELIITDVGCNNDLGEVTYMVTDLSCLTFESYNCDSKYFIYHLR